MTPATALALDPTVPDELDFVTDEMDFVTEDTILEFLTGQTDGHEALDALYGAVLDEPIPARLLALVRSPSRD